MENDETRTIEIAFLGDIQDANCECHKGQFMLVVYVVLPGKPNQVITIVPFKTRAEAETEMPKIISITANEVISAMGLKSKGVQEFNKVSAEAANKIMRDFQTRNNPNLH